MSFSIVRKDGSIDHIEMENATITLRDGKIVVTYLSCELVTESMEIGNEEIIVLHED